MLESSGQLADAIEETNGDITSLDSDVRAAAAAGKYPPDRVAAWDSLRREWHALVVDVAGWNRLEWIVLTGDTFDRVKAFRERVRRVRAELVAAGATVKTPDPRPPERDGLDRLEADAAAIGKVVLGGLAMLVVIEGLRAVRS